MKSLYIIIGLVVLSEFLTSGVIWVVLYVNWKKERRLKQLARQRGILNYADVPSRQSQRYKHSSIFNLITFTGYEVPSFTAFQDRFCSFQDVSNAINEAGITDCDVIMGIDFTASNEWQGRHTFQKQCLHAILLKNQNPYQKVINTLGATLQPVMGDGLIYGFGFGDKTTKDSGVVSFVTRSQPCKNHHELLKLYNKYAQSLTMSGPTSFAPIINKAIDLTINSENYCILIIISDGQVCDGADETVNAIVEASNHALSIVMIGVGDGPWDTMEQFDDLLPRRKFDNFQFVDLNKVTEQARSRTHLKHSTFDATLSLHAFMELPDQYKAIRELNYI